MNKHRVIFEGTIDKVESEGDAYVYYGSILGRGTWKGIDGHEIKYEDSQRKIVDVFEEGAPTFNGVPLVYGHHLQTREAVKGFNAVAWRDGDVIRNKGYIFNPETIALVKQGKFPMGQSMEAWVWVDNEMYAQRIEGTVVAIGIEKPAYKGGLIEKGKGVKLEMGTFAEQIKAKLEELELDEEKVNTILELVKNVHVVEGEIDNGYVLMPDRRFAELKAAEKAAEGTDTLKTKLEQLTTEINAMKAKDQKDEKDIIVGEIQVLNGEFKVDEYLEGVEDHGLQMRMLKAYYERISELEAILPQRADDVEVKLTDDEETKIMLALTGKTPAEFLKLKEDE